MHCFGGSVLVMQRTAFASMAKPVVEVMSSYDQYNSRKNKIDLILMKKLFGEEKKKTGRKKQHR